MDMKKIVATSSIAMALAISGTAIISPQAHASTISKIIPSRLERTIATPLSDNQTPKRDMQQLIQEQYKPSVSITSSAPNSLLSTHSLWSMGNLFDEIASLLGMTNHELKQHLQDGDTIAQIAEHQGMEQTKIADVLVTNISIIWQQQRAAGQITQSQYEQYRVEAENQAQRIINSAM
ncbi:hypothetical protein [Paenibacillus kyungheensis]